MIIFLKKYRKRKDLDCLAHEIADRYGMTAEFEADKMGGVCPLEVEVGEKNDNSKKCRNLCTFIPIIISLAALAFSIISYMDSRETTLLLSSEEYRMSQGMKNDLVEMMAALRSIDDKAALSKRDWREYDFSNELQLLNDIQFRPGYLVFLYMLHDDGDRFEIEEGLKTLTGDYLASKKASMTDIRQQAERIMKVLEYHPSLTNEDAISFDTMLQFLLKARNYDAVEVGDVIREHDSRRKDFLEKLMREGFEDPNIRYYYYTFVVSDSALAHQAREAGAFPITYDSTSNLGLFEQKEVWKQSLWHCMEYEYAEKYHEFLISR